MGITGEARLQGRDATSAVDLEVVVAEVVVPVAAAGDAQVAAPIEAAVADALAAAPAEAVVAADLVALRAGMNQDVIVGETRVAVLEAPEATAGTTEMRDRVMLRGAMAPEKRTENRPNPVKIGVRNAEMTRIGGRKPPIVGTRTENPRRGKACCDRPLR